MITLLQGDCRDLLSTLPERSVQMCVTSPPYWRLRKYTDDPQEIGLEETIAGYVAALVQVFDGVWRVLADTGTLWLNLGDAYANDTKWGGASGGKNYTSAGGNYAGQRVKSSTGLPPKSLIGLPWRVAFALQDQGWVLRAEIIWEKPNGMPESVKDRPTLAHEHLFLLAKQGDYYCNMAAIREAISPKSEFKEAGRYSGADKAARAGLTTNGTGKHSLRVAPADGMRNARSVWSIPTRGIPDEHYAPYPDELPRRCILAGSRQGDIVLDPFAGSGTTCRVAEQVQRHSIGIDLGYQSLQERRTDGVQVMMADLL